MDVQIRNGFCVTHSRKIGLFYGGTCPFSYKSNSSNRLFSKLCASPEELENVMCGSYNRKGFQCGECLDGYGLGVYTMIVKCAQCSNYSVTSAKLLYLLVALVPIVIFFICVMVRNLNLMSGPMLGYVLFCQRVAFSIEYDGVIHDHIESHLPASFRIVFKAFLVVTEFWRLSDLKPIIPPFCISEKLNGVHVLLLHTIPAFYAFLLVTVSLGLIHLYANNYSRVVRKISNL